MKPRFGLAVAAIVFTAGCSVAPKDTSPTLKSLEKRTVTIDTTAQVKPDASKAKQSYEALLKNTDDEALRRRAMRRLADLELMEQEEEATPALGESADIDSTATVPAEPDYAKAIALYEGLIKSFPDREDNDRIYYQLSRAYEQVGEIEKSLDVLTTLVEKYPNTKYYEEAQFRRGELLFVFQEFAKAEPAYKEAIRLGKESPFYERATYKRGWSLYKQERYLDALEPFLALVDLKLANNRLGENLDDYAFLSGGDKEVLNDAFRVISLCFSHLDGTQTLSDYFTNRDGANYEFLLYRGLGDFFVKQERYLEAAQAYRTFGGVRTPHPQGMLLTIKAIELYKERGYADLVVETKEEFINRYAKYSTYWANNSHYGFDEYLIRSDSSIEKRINDYAAESLEELGRIYHARAQKSKSSADFGKAIKWYQMFARSFLQHPKTPEMNFLLAEALYEDGRYTDAIREYEKTAYNYRRHELGAEAGYAALVTYEKYKGIVGGDDREFWDRIAIQSAQRFTKLYPKDPRTATVLVKVVDELFEKQQYSQASVFAKRILAIVPKSQTKPRRQAMIVIAHTSFEEEAFKEAEVMYSSALRLTAADDKNRAALVDRLAASVYKQGEALRERGQLEASTKEFLRIAMVAPSSAIRVTADYDAAANMLAAESWAQAIPLLEAFQLNHPGHELQAEVTNNLAIAYLESGNHIKAADQLQKIATAEQDPARQRDAIWQSAGLYEKGQAFDSAVGAYKRYIKEHPTPFDQAVEARQKIIDIFAKTGQDNSVRFWQQEVVTAVQPNTSNYNDRSRFIAASAALALAEPAYETFHARPITAPLKQSIQSKRQSMEAALKAFNLAAEYRVADITTASTFRIGEIYNEFSQALLNSERPKGLSEEALDQFELVLEDQAYPFEEKAIEIHQANAERAASGLYDQWVKKSFTALATLLPARYGKIERNEAIVNELR